MSNNILRVSVIIPTYNRATLVGRAINSVLQQSYSNLEVIVVDDGSSDNTRDIVLKAFSDKRIRYFWQPNRGVSAARNKGIKEAKGDVICFLDSDDLWKPNKLEKQINFLTSHPQINLVFCDLEQRYGNRPLKTFVQSSKAFSRLIRQYQRNGGAIVIPRLEAYKALLKALAIHVDTIAIRKAEISAAGGFDTSFLSCEDWEFILRLAERNDIGYLNEALAITFKNSPDSLARSSEEPGFHRRLSLLTEKLNSTRDDIEVHKAIREAIRYTCQRLRWLYRSRNQKELAFRTCLQAFFKTRDPHLLIMALTSFIPCSLTRLLMQK